MDTKNDEPRGVHICKLLYDLIQEKAKVRKINSVYLFENDKGNFLYLRGAYQKIVKQCNIKDLRFHDLRHTAASYLAMNGASLLEIAEILGHKTLAMVKRYAHLTKKHTAQLIESTAEKELEGLIANM